jgi:2-keto-4-pentenoate hydratase/2-oxohepta-3-ene-1,7-dioic acid hydratase in catechol pathway
MRLVTFEDDTAGSRIGVAVDDAAGTMVVDLSVAAPALPTEMTAFLLTGADGLSLARAAQTSGVGRLPIASVRLLAPVTRPGKVLAIGLNYADHVKESGMEMPQHQIWFNKQWNSITGPGEVAIPAVAPKYVDYEAELCLVIGRRCRHVPRERAHEVIAGYTCGNDVSVRDWQRRVSQFTLGKSFQTHGPIGPWLVTPDEFGDPHAKSIECFVNDERRQHSNTEHLIFDCYAQIAELSSAFELDVGDVIFTGTPDGVGGAMKPPRFLRAGDRVRVRIEGIGDLDNHMVDEQRVTVID